MPVSAGARQARHLHPEHQADVAKANFRNKALEASSVSRRGTGATEVVIDHLNPPPRPAETLSVLNERVLQPGRLLVLLHLTQGRLAHIKHRQTVQVTTLNLPREVHCPSPCFLRHGHCRAPPRPAWPRDGGGSSGRGGPQSAAGSLPAGAPKLWLPLAASASWRLATHSTRASNAVRPTRGPAVARSCFTDRSGAVDGGVLPARLQSGAEPGRGCQCGLEAGAPAPGAGAP